MDKPDLRQCACGCVFSAHHRIERSDVYVCAHHDPHRLVTKPDANS